MTSDLATLDSGDVVADVAGNSLTAKTRYGLVVSADTGTLSLGQVVAGTSDYSVTFTVNAPSFVVYDLKIDTSRLGAYTLIDDTALNGATRADVSAVTGSLNAVTNALLGLADVATANGAGNTNIGTINTPISQNNTLTIPGLSGSNTLTLRFVWTNLVYTNPGANTTETNSTNGSFVFGGDEVAIRMGRAGSATSISGGIAADDYPGTGGRTLANDGHFVNISANITFVPEPSSVVLAGMGLVGLVGLVLRRRTR